MKRLTSLRLGRASFGVVAMALGCFAALACRTEEAGHDHASEHAPGHDHHQEGHGHGDVAMQRVTRWTAHYELFAEYPAAVAGQELSMLCHLTALGTFHPLTAAKVRLELTGPASLSAETTTPSFPGIFPLTFTPPEPGTYRGRLFVASTEGGGGAAGAEGVERSTSEAFAEIVIVVAAAGKQPEPSAEHEEEGQFIELLKEQQWGVPFATEFARRGTLSASIEVAGSVTTPPGGSAEVGAPIAGRLIPSGKGLLRPGEAVKKGQLLALLAPTPSSPEEAARARLLVTEAEARMDRAHVAKDRAERLLADHAISEREVEDARREATVSEESLRAAKSTAQVFAGAAAGAGGGSWRLVSPIDGILVDVSATPGAAVGPGSVLFRVVDPRELWIRARVAERDAARLRGDRDASYQIAGLDEYLPLDVTGDDANATLVTIGRVVDPTSRTVDVIYSLRAPDPRLRVGGFVRVSVPTGEEFTGIAVPESAVLDNDGTKVVYVQVDGEHFAKRMVRTGPRQGELVGIVNGLLGDERIVTRGAHIVRLAERGASSEPHGHIH